MKEIAASFVGDYLEISRFSKQWNENFLRSLIYLAFEMGLIN